MLGFITVPEAIGTALALLERGVEALEEIATNLREEN